MKSNKRPKRKLPIWSNLRTFYYLLLVIGIIAFPFALVISRDILFGLVASVVFNPYLLLIYIPSLCLFYIAFRNRKNICQAPKKLYKESQSLVPENKLTRLVLNIGFVVAWHRVCILIDNNNYVRSLELYWSPQYVFFIFTLLLTPILLITLFLWYKDIPNTFINAKKETKRRLKTTANSLSKSNISDADELKKYADLKDQGIITEDEFQAKKKKLLDL